MENILYQGSSFEDGVRALLNHGMAGLNKKKFLKQSARQDQHPKATNVFSSKDPILNSALKLYKSHVGHLELGDEWSIKSVKADPSSLANLYIKNNLASTFDQSIDLVNRVFKHVGIKQSFKLNK